MIDYAIGVLKHQNSDFFVREELGFDLTNEGEHIWLFIEKDGLNTAEIIKALSRYTGLPKKNIGYSGLKDKHAITCQWFSLYYPGKNDIDFSEFSLKNVKILKITRHNKKLKIGTHNANFFQLLIKELKQPFSVIELKLKAIDQHGFVNLFGEQRFGHNNLQQARDVINGTLVLNKKDHGFILSVMRSYLFNAYANFRKQNKTDQVALVGDVVGFMKSNSVFSVTADNQAEIQARLVKKELVLAAPLIGKRQKLFFADEALTHYIHFCADYAGFIRYLEQHTEMQFRSMFCMPKNFIYDYNEIENTLALSFILPAGAYATSLVDALG